MLDLLMGLLVWEAPDGPNTPWSTATFVFDMLRVAVLSMSISIIILSIVALQRPSTLGNKMRLLGASIFIVSIAGTEATHIGDLGHWRLYANFIGCVAATWGLYSYFRWEKPGELRLEKE